MKNSSEKLVPTTEKVTVSIGKQNYQATITAGKHTFLADEPENKGGRNSGPNPDDFLLSALGSCMAITLRMYAERKNWLPEKITISLAFSEPGNSTGLTEKQQTFKRKITGEIMLYGNLTPEQITRFNVIAHKCPVHKALSPAFDIEIEAKAGPPEFQ